MSKIKKLTVSNLKAVSSQTADFNGCTAIITGGNNKGKTSFLRGLFDRLRGSKPDAVLKTGETNGFAECELTTGEKLKWEFKDNGNGLKEKLTYITDKEIKYALTVELRNKFLPEIFDVDRFLTDPPSKQKKTLQQLVGIDFTDIDNRYKAAYDEREALNRRANEERIIFSDMPVPEKIEQISLDDLMLQKAAIRNKLNTQYLENKKANDALRNAWNKECDEVRKEIEEFNNTQKTNSQKLAAALQCSVKLNDLGYTGIEVGQFCNLLRLAIQDEKEYLSPSEPAYIQELPDDKDLQAIDSLINLANETNKKAGEYSAWIKQQEKYTTANNNAIAANKKVADIEAERMLLIKSAKLPPGFGFTDDGITYNELSFTREQLSSSGIYVAALKLAAMNLGEIKTLHFDASFLDNASLANIEEWAKSEDLQLLIEMPDRSGSNIQYELICDE